MRPARSPLAAFHASNVLTYASLLAAVAAIASGAAGNRAAAGALIAIAVVLDTFDGRFARLFDRSDAQRHIGAQLDSLADAIAFGIAPVLVLSGTRMWGPAWLAGPAIYAGCAITRLAFYNVTHEERRGFVGLPVPVAALVLASALLFDPGAIATTSLLLVTGVAMVWPVRIPRPSGAGLAAFVCWPVAVIVAHLATR